MLRVRCLVSLTTRKRDKHRRASTRSVQSRKVCDPGSWAWDLAPYSYEGSEDALKQLESNCGEVVCDTILHKPRVHESQAHIHLEVRITRFQGGAPARFE